MKPENEVFKGAKFIISENITEVQSGQNIFQLQVKCIPVQGEMYFGGEFENAGRSSSVSLGVRAGHGGLWKCKMGKFEGTARSPGYIVVQGRPQDPTKVK